MKLTLSLYCLAMRQDSPPGIYDLRSQQPGCRSDRERGMVHREGVVLTVPKEGNVMTAGSLPLVLRCANLTILWRALRLMAVQLAYQAVIQPDRMLDCASVKVCQGFG